jgi:7-cyano-7-deazaguanine reductase
MSDWEKRLNDAFRATGWSKAELGRRSGVQYDSLNKYLAGKVKHPRGDSLFRLAQSLSVNLSWLRDGTGPKKGGGAIAATAQGVENLTQLGGGPRVPATPDEAVLETVPNPHAGKDYLIRFTCPEFTSLCPVTGQPDFAHLAIDYVPDLVIVESKSLKLFLGSYRNHGGFHEACTLEVATRLIDAAKPKWLRIGGYWYPRGGIPIDVFFQTGLPPKTLWVPEQGVPPYRGRG